jgi:hypothetical protein
LKYRILKNEEFIAAESIRPRLLGIWLENIVQSGIK